MVAADPVALTALLAVQELDRQLDGLRHRRVTLPEHEALAEVAAEQAERDAAAAEVQGQRHELERQQKRLEDEIAGLEKRKSLVEDQVLELMEQIEPVDAQLRASADAAAVLAERARDLQAALDAAGSEIDAETADVEARRSAHVAEVPDELLAVYDRLRAQPGRVGVARLVGGTCHGCHLELAAVEVDRLKKLPANELVTCDECGCILVR